MNPFVVFLICNLIYMKMYYKLILVKIFNVRSLSGFESFVYLFIFKGGRPANKVI